MRYIRPHYFDDFECIADKCPATCCAGWQIMIDDESLDKYEKVPGAFGERLRNSIDWSEGCFYQYGRRCAFLDENDLCDIYKELGPEGFCKTCRMYPRHEEEYEGLREFSLSLSCPEAARIILECKEPVRFLESFTEEEDEEFDDMDILLFTQLEETRELIFGILQDRPRGLSERKQAVLAAVWEIQAALDEGEYFKVDEIIDTYQSKSGNEVEIEKKAFSQKTEELEFFRKLELLRDDWGKMTDLLENTLFNCGEEKYKELETEFEEWLKTPGKEDSLVDSSSWEIMQEQLLMFFIYTYFCGAVYDNYIYAKAALAVFSVDWIREFCMLRWLMNGRKLFVEDVIEISYRYAREVEHSDLNLETLIQELDAQSSELW